MNPPATATPITVQVFLLATFLSIVWSIYLRKTAADWLDIVRASPKKNRLDTVVVFRRLIVAICVFMLPFGFMVRTALVLLGFGDQIGGQVLFYALAGTNIPGSVFVALTVLKPEWFD